MKMNKYEANCASMDYYGLSNKPVDKCEFYSNLAFALTSPASLAAISWLVTSFLSVLFGSSIVSCLSFTFPLIIVPYIVHQQMRVQLQPALRKRVASLRSEANSLAMKNVNLTSTQSRLIRQDYRLSAVEERFEHLCKIKAEDITKMKHLAKKNASLQRKVKVNAAADKIETLMTSMIRHDNNGKSMIREWEIDEFVSNIKFITGRNSWKVKDDDIREGLLASLSKKRVIEIVKNDMALERRWDNRYDKETRMNIENRLEQKKMNRGKTGANDNSNSSTTIRCTY